MEKKMTQKEFYTAIAALEIDADLVAYATEAIAKIDAANEKAKAKRAEKVKERKAEDIELMDAIAEIMNGVEEPMTASAVKEALAVEELKVQKVSALLRAMVADGKATATDVKVQGKGTAKGYTLA